MPRDDPLQEDEREVISTDDYMYFVNSALDAMVEIVTDLGDELANRKPEIEGANSPYVILTHCLGVMQYWAGELVAGRLVERNRPAEFRASGPVRDLLERTSSVREQFSKDVATVQDGTDPLRREPQGSRSTENDPITKNQGVALVHVYEELAQHRGHMEITRDLIKASWVPPA